MIIFLLFYVLLKKVIMNFHGTILLLWSILYCFSEWDWKSLNSSLIVFSCLDMPAFYMYWVLQSRLDAFHYSQSEWQGSPEKKGWLKSTLRKETSVWFTKICFAGVMVIERTQGTDIFGIWKQATHRSFVNQRSSHKSTF